MVTMSAFCRQWLLAIRMASLQRQCDSWSWILGAQSTMAIDRTNTILVQFGQNIWRGHQRCARSLTMCQRPMPARNFHGQCAMQWGSWRQCLPQSKVSMRHLCSRRLRRPQWGSKWSWPNRKLGLSSNRSYWSGHAQSAMQMGNCVSQSHGNLTMQSREWQCVQSQKALEQVNRKQKLQRRTQSLGSNPISELEWKLVCTMFD